MNRLVLIGNGFDLAHGLKTSYADFINWYFEKRYDDLLETHNDVSEDPLLTIRYQWHEAICTYLSNLSYCNWQFRNCNTKEKFDRIIGDVDHFETKFSPLFERIIKGLESKTWAGIEQDYYDLLKEYAFRDPNVNPTEPPIKALNQQLRFLQQLLVEYLQDEAQKKITKIPSIEKAIFAPINTKDVSVFQLEQMKEHVTYWLNEGYDYLLDKEQRFGFVPNEHMDELELYKVKPWSKKLNDYPQLTRLPNRILLLNFNYTHTPRMYFHNDVMDYISIHGNLEAPQSVIFGYGDELDDKFKELKAHKNNACLSHVKSIRYLEAPNYRQMLSFIESEPFQVLIMGHSCGNSDRTLLNTIFEHPNCVSIKPYYYVTDKEKGTDNYTELVQHISRNFNDMKLMRARVVNKTQCEPLVKE